MDELFKTNDLYEASALRTADKASFKGVVVENGQKKFTFLSPEKCQLLIDSLYGGALTQDILAYSQSHSFLKKKLGN